MLLNFKITDTDFRCTNPEVTSTAISINYLKCHFDVESSMWNDVDAIVAVFKCATYNVHSEVMLDSNNNCLVDPEVYKRGGTIQVKLIGDKYVPGDTVISSTHVTAVVEFQVREGIILPTVTPSKYDVFVAELELAQNSVENAITDIYTRAENGEFDGANGVGISSVTYNSNGTVTVTLDDGSSFTSEYSMKGEAGEDGADGVGITDITYGQDGTVVITLSDGTQFVSEYSMKGEQGPAGDDGEAGEDGFSPSASVVKVGNTATITITDKDGTTTASISDGNTPELVQSDWDESEPNDPAYILNKPTLFSGDYDDLTNKPTIPTYTAGTGIDITNGVISLDLSQAEGGDY